MLGEISVIYDIPIKVTQFKFLNSSLVKVLPETITLSNTHLSNLHKPDIQNI